MVYHWLRRLAPARLAHSCLLCEAAADDQPLCEDCLHDLPWHLAACEACGLPVAAGATHCDECRWRPPLQRRTIAPLRYEFPVDHLVAALKYHGRLAHAPLLGAWLRDAVLAQADTLPDLLLPVPLHDRRLGERGYNQALEIARPLARATGLPLETRLLQRRRATAAQMHLNAHARARNPHGAFAVDPRRLDELGPLAAVALIDDVMTTGATLQAAALALQDAGIARVEFWVVARTP